MNIAKSFLAVVLCLTMVMTGCTASWIKVALADLPVLVQMALNIAGLVSTLQSGKPISPAEVASINAISAEANADLTLLQKAYDDYKAAPNATNQQKIEDVIATIDRNLPALLAAAHIKDAVLSARVAAAVTLILNTVTAFSVLIPQPVNPVVQQMKRTTAASAVKGVSVVPSPKELKAQWNQEVYPQF